LTTDYSDFTEVFNPKNEIQFRIQAFGTTETLRTTEKTDLKNLFLSDFSGAQYFSG
jgi:hypothetical protein